VTILLFVALLALQQVIFNVLAPRILSRQVGLHPVLVFFAVLTGRPRGKASGAPFRRADRRGLYDDDLVLRAKPGRAGCRLQERLPVRN